MSESRRKAAPGAGGSPALPHAGGRAAATFARRGPGARPRAVPGGCQPLPAVPLSLGAPPGTGAGTLSAEPAERSAGSRGGGGFIPALPHPLCPGPAPHQRHFNPWPDLPPPTMGTSQRSSGETRRKLDASGPERCRCAGERWQRSPARHRFSTVPLAPGAFHRLQPSAETPDAAATSTAWSAVPALGNGKIKGSPSLTVSLPYKELRASVG